jgi:signal transduction histidine kinase
VNEDALTRTLLLVDDDERNLDLLEAILEPLGHKTLRATHGKDAIKILDKGDVDLVLLDVMMPEITGFDVLSYIRSRPTYRQIPVVLITAAVRPEHRLEGLRLGASEFLEKPVDQAILVTRVRSLLRLQFATDELLRRNRELEQLRHDQEEMINFIAHDLRSPLAAVAGNLGYVLDEAMLTAEQKEALEDSQRAVRSADGMIADLLAVARAEEVSMHLERSPVALSELFRQVQSSHSAELRMRGVELRVESAGEILLLTEAELLARVFDNIVRNAMRHTPRGGRILMQARQGAAIEIRLSNSGPPIPIEERERVFEKFWRATGCSMHGSVGLGLYFCRLVVEAHGGRIHVEQSPDWPVSFVIQLPLYEAQVVFR